MQGKFIRLFDTGSISMFGMAAEYHFHVALKRADGGSQNGLDPTLV